LAATFTFGDFELDEPRFELRRRGERMLVQPKVLRLLFLLVAQRHRAVSDEELMAVLWPNETVGRASIKRAVMGARTALENRGQSCIRTIRGHGYQFVLPVEDSPLSGTTRPAPTVPPVLPGPPAPVVVGSGPPRRAEDAPEAPLAVGHALDDYVIDGVLGAGGGGTVYAARHRVLGKRVALKVVHAHVAKTPGMVTRFTREAQAVHRISHPNVVDIIGFGELAPGRPYYVMELLDGIDLRRLLQIHGRFSPAETLSLLEPVLKAVQAAHAAGILHRDIKANDIVVVETREGRAIKLLDFGVAKLLWEDSAAPGLTQPGTTLGTAHNMAPEQIRSEPLDERTDIYALGVLLYQLLTGRYPFTAHDPRELALLHLGSPAQRPSSVVPLSPALDAVVLRCLEKQPDRRFLRVGELLTALRHAVSGAEVSSTGQAALGLGLHFELKLAAEISEDMFEDINDVFDTLEGELTARGFSLPVRRSNALLAVRLITASNQVTRERAEGKALVAELEAMLHARPNAHPGVQLLTAVSVGEVFCRSTGSGIQLASGALLDVASWPRQELGER
jgi:DNA-binding winged helix-turn-helix (wHTH) protein